MAIVHFEKDNFDAEVMNSDVPVLIDFWADWCMPCRMLGPIFEKVSGDYDGKIKFGKVNVDKDGELAGKFGVSGIPALIMVSKGKEVGRIVGMAPEPILKQKIDELYAKI